MATIEVLTENQRRRRWSAKRIKRDSGIGLSLVASKQELLHKKLSRWRRLFQWG